MFATLERAAMPRSWRLGILVVIFVLGFVGFAKAPDAASDPCEQIRTACRTAGFVQGGIQAGNGLQIDCFDPIVRGTTKPSASRPLPQIDRQLAAACRAANPGQDLKPAQVDAKRQGPASVMQTATSIAGAAPTGLVAVVVNKPGEPLDQTTFNNPYIRGVALQIHWSDIEPVEGNARLVKAG